MNSNLEYSYQKLEKLKEYIKSLKSVAVAFSNGVDSTFLLKTAHDVLGNKAVAVTIDLKSAPKYERGEAELFCKKENIRQIIVKFDELSVNGFKQNPPNRCYLCKTAIFKKIRQISDELGLNEIVEGSNVDDDGDYRPGMKALSELGIKSPLRYAELIKEEIRLLSKEMGLPTWNKPSSACLSSRFVYGEEITEEKLNMVGEAENYLCGQGFKQCRCRIHGKIARLEILPEDFAKMLEEEIRDKIYKKCKSLGFTYITLDLKGYRTGSMNETLSVSVKEA